MIPDHVVPGDSDHRDGLVERLECLKVVECDVAQSNAKRTFVANQFGDNVLSDVVDFGVVARLGVAKKQDLEVFGFGLLVKRKVNRLRQWASRFNARVFEPR